MTYLHLDVGTGEQRTEPADGWAGPLQALKNLKNSLHDPPVALVTSTVSGLDGVGLARCAAVGISPLSGAVAETRAEGPFAAGMRRAGIVGLSLTGTAPSPSYVVVRDGRASLRPAEDLWGQDTRVATDALLARHGREAAVAVIGPAGESGTRYASIVTCGSFPLPRLGFGALLGAKRIKAVVCLPAHGNRPADDRRMAALTSAYRREMRDHPLAGWQYAQPGFGAWPGTVADPGYMSVGNFARTGPTTWPSLAPQRFADHLSRSGGGCPGCPNDCIKG